MQPACMFFFLLVQLNYSWSILYLIKFCSLLESFVTQNLGKICLGWDFWRSFCLMPCSKRGAVFSVRSRFLQFCPIWKIFEEEKSLASLYHLLMCLIGLARKAFFPKICAEFWTSCNLQLLVFVLLLCTSDMNLLQAFLNALWVAEDAHLAFSIPSKFCFLSLSSSAVYFSP